MRVEARHPTADKEGEKARQVLAFEGAAEREDNGHEGGVRVRNHYATEASSLACERAGRGLILRPTHSAEDQLLRHCTSCESPKGVSRRTDGGVRSHSGRVPPVPQEEHSQTPLLARPTETEGGRAIPAEDERHIRKEQEVEAP